LNILYLQSTLPLFDYWLETHKNKTNGQTLSMQKSMEERKWPRRVFCIWSCWWNNHDGVDCKWNMHMLQWPADPNSIRRLGNAITRSWTHETNAKSANWINFGSGECNEHFPQTFNKSHLIWVQLLSHCQCRAPKTENRACGTGVQTRWHGSKLLN